jgi:hypothetical protein
MPAEERAAHLRELQGDVSTPDDLRRVAALEQLDASLSRAEQAEANNADTELRADVGFAIDNAMAGLAVADLEALQERASGTAYEEPLARALAYAETIDDLGLEGDAETRAAWIAGLRESGVTDQLDRALLNRLVSIEDDFQRAQQQATDAENRELADDVRFAVNALMDGVTPAELDALRERVAGTPYEATLDKATGFASELDTAFADTPQERAERMEALRSGAADTIDLEMLRNLRALDKNARELAESDVVTYGQRAGLVGTDPVDVADPASVSARVAQVAAAADHAGLGPSQIRFLSDAEAEALGAQIAGASVEDRLAMATTIVSNFGDDAHAVLEELDQADPLFAHAGHLMAMTGSRDAATFLLRGVEILDSGGGPKPANATREATFATHVKGALAGAPPRLRGTLQKSADAIFAARGGGIAEGEDVDAERRLYAEAVQAAAGQTTKNGRTVGGVQEVGGLVVLLPPELDANAAATALETATPADFAAASAFGKPHDGPDPWPPAPAAPSAGTGTGPPTRDGFANMDWSSNDRGRMVLRARPGGTYAVGFMRGGALQWLRDPESPNGIYHLDLSALARRTSGRRD